MKLLTTDELATRGGMSPGTLRNWRMVRRGPRFIRIGRTVRYRLADVKKWEARR